jgi:hypothetical protein
MMTRRFIAHRWGPATGGLFLAFPAIFPANATLVKRHEQRKKKRAASHASFAGAKQPALDAAVAALVHRCGRIRLDRLAKLLVPNKSRIVFGGASCFGMGLRDKPENPWP